MDAEQGTRSVACVLGALFLAVFLTVSVITYDAAASRSARTKTLDSSMMHALPHPAALSLGGPGGPPRPPLRVVIVQTLVAAAHLAN